ncbi:sugar ABC transporter permease [Clostridia bacterium]|nr:sugar ABC transporter permease [Clostridia bacterium]
MKRHRLEPVVFNTINIGLLLILSVIMLYPMLNTLALSFNDGKDAVKGGIGIFPRIFSTDAYRVVFNQDALSRAFFVSALRVVVQVVLNLFFTAMLAYAISRKEYIWAKPITVIFVLTMYFNAGLIPNYMLIKDLHMIGTFQVYWVPSIISAFNLIVMRTQIKALPESLMESARIDGAGDFRIFFQIVLPLIVPVLATIALFVAVGTWNAWFDTLLYNNQGIKWTVVQYELQKLLASAMSTLSSYGTPGEAGAGLGPSVTPTTLRAAITIATTVPILIVYPFLQRYFVTGLTIGGVKE